MQRAILTLAALLLAFPALDAQTKDPFAGPPAAPGRLRNGPVVVDPADLRPPIPDIVEEFTHKYDGKTVRFTGIVKKSGQDANKRYWYLLETEAGPTAKGKAKKAKPTPVSVTVYFQSDEKQLRTQPPATPLTVEGRGDVGTDKLFIRDARILVSKP